MTRQETFKRRIRERMSKTGERYGAARRSLIEHGSGQGDRTWVSDPQFSEDKIREATGRGWDEWCDIIDAWPGRDDGHQAIARYLSEQMDVADWWSQTVTVGYERITGLRMPNQSPDGTFTASKSKTVHIDPTMVRGMLLDEGDRADLFPGFDTELVSRPGTKAIRMAMGPGVALFDLNPLDDGRVRLTVVHERLPSADDVQLWKSYWADWLAAVDGVDQGR